MAERNLPERRSYVYVIFRPDGTPCYVGKGKGNRWAMHALGYPTTTNRHLSAIYAQAGGDLPVVKVREDLSDSEAIKIEIALIAAIGREAHGGPLVNFTDGGDGVTGWKQSEETKRRRSEKMKGNHLRVGYEPWMKGKTHSPEIRAQISAKKKGSPGPNPGIPRSADVKRKISVTKRSLRGRQLQMEGV